MVKTLLGKYTWNVHCLIDWIDWWPQDPEQKKKIWKQITIQSFKKQRFRRFHGKWTLPSKSAYLFTYKHLCQNYCSICWREIVSSIQDNGKVFKYVRMSIVNKRLFGNFSRKTVSTMLISASFTQDIRWQNDVWHLLENVNDYTLKTLRHLYFLCFQGLALCMPERLFEAKGFIYHVPKPI